MFNPDLTFSQQLVAAAGQSCTVNTVTWTGDVSLQDASTAVVSYIRCSPSGAGCLTCGPTREEVTRFKFNTDCSTLTLVVATGSNESTRVYSAARKRLSA